jgi:hypothetical protein
MPEVFQDSVAAVAKVALFPVNACLGEIL